MTFTRRSLIAAGAAAAAVLALPVRLMAAASDAVAEYTGGAEAAAEGITLTAPEIAENGNTVPIEVEAPGATEIRVFADGNPLPGIATFGFGPLAARQFAATPIRLAQTQDVVAVAKMPDGSFRQASQLVKVTIGGCGG